MIKNMFLLYIVLPLIMQGPDEAHIRQESEEFITAMKLLETNQKWKTKSEKEVKVWEMDV